MEKPYPVNSALAAEALCSQDGSNILPLSSCLALILVLGEDSDARDVEIQKQLSEMIVEDRELGLCRPRVPFQLIAFPKNSECQKLYELATRIGNIPKKAELQFRTALGLVGKESLSQALKTGLSFTELVDLAPNSLKVQRCLATVKTEDAKKQLVAKVQAQLRAQACYLKNLEGYWQAMGVCLALKLARNYWTAPFASVDESKVQKALSHSLPEPLYERLEQEVELILGLFQLFQDCQHALGEKLPAITEKKVNLDSEEGRMLLLTNCLVDDFCLSWQQGPLNSDRRPSQKEQNESFSHWIYVLKQQSFRERTSLKKGVTAPLMETEQQCFEKRLENGGSWTDKVFKTLCETGQIGKDRDYWYGYLKQCSAAKRFYLEQLHWQGGLPYQTLGQRTPKQVYPLILSSGEIQWFSKPATQNIAS